MNNEAANRMEGDGMTKSEAQEYGYAVEPYGGGFILVDYSGKRGTFGAAYRGRGDVWFNQPSGMSPFATEADAWAAAS